MCSLSVIGDRIDLCFPFFETELPDDGVFFWSLGQVWCGVVWSGLVCGSVPGQISLAFPVICRRPAPPEFSCS